jgi:hypothetical protein
MNMTIDQIKVVASIRSALQEELTVHTKDGQTITGTCTFAGTSKFRLDTPLAACFFNYGEVESVE